MIRVQQQPEPDDFDSLVRQPGRNALWELTGDPRAPTRRGRKRKVIAKRIEDIPGKDLPDKWTDALPALRAAYSDVCAYLGMRIHPATGAATVDHFRPKSNHQELAYEWSNFRLATGQVNSSKGNHEDVLDPFEIDDGWFVLNLGTFEVEPAPGIDDPTRRAVAQTITRLKLNEPTFCQARGEYHDRYHGLTPDGDRYPLSWLKEECPFLARELARRGSLRDSRSAGEAGETP